MSQFTIEVTTTQACNFNCDYCFEREFIPKKTILDTNYSILIKRIEELVYQKWIMDTFDHVQISFWGGEPTLNLEMIDNIVERFKEEERVHFHIYTNGSRIDDLIKIALKVYPRFNIQVSYDGNPVHDLRRRTRDDKPTTEIVKSALRKLKRNEISFATKSTITYKDFHHLPEIWDDFYSLRKELGDDTRYAVTVDYHTIEFYKYKVSVEKSLLELAKKELNFYRKEKSFLTNIFSHSQKTVCSTHRMMTIDTDGKVYFCHGCIYSDCSEDLKFASIFDDKFSEKVYQHYLRFKDRLTPKECDDCVSLTCLRCNVKKYENSIKSGTIEKWTDYTNQKEICDYYKLAGRIGRALLNITEEGN